MLAWSPESASIWDPVERVLRILDGPNYPTALDHIQLRSPRLCISRVLPSSHKLKAASRGVNSWESTGEGNEINTIISVP